MHLNIRHQHLYFTWR